MSNLSHRENMLKAYKRDSSEFVHFELSLSPKMVKLFKEKSGSDKSVEEYFGISSPWISPKRIKPKQDFSKYFSYIYICQKM